MTIRYVVRPLHDSLCGEGWTLWDLVEDRASGGWFAAREAAELTAAGLNDDPDRHARLLAELVAERERRAGGTGAPQPTQRGPGTASGSGPVRTARPTSATAPVSATRPTSATAPVWTASGAIFTAASAS